MTRSVRPLLESTTTTLACPVVSRITLRWGTGSAWLRTPSPICTQEDI
jgi:hypothetical protein